VFRRARKGPACLRRGREVGGGAESATTSDAETRYRTVLQVCLLVSGALTSSSSRTHSLFCPVHLRGSLDADGLATWGGRFLIRTRHGPCHRPAVRGRTRWHPFRSVTEKATRVDN
jgi:hypothetical protein